MSLSYTFGRFEVRPAQRRVLEAGEPVALGARAFDLLTVLIAHRDRVVGKDELIALVWPGLVVEENNLTVQVSALRKVLGAGAISTVPGRGYRFTPEVRESVPSVPVAPATTSAASPVPPHSLPAERSSFVGRQQEIHTVQRLLSERRLVTLTGIGGSGKTRLALQVGALQLGSHADGVFFVDLAPVSDGSVVAKAVAAACGFSLGDAPERIGGSAIDRLVSALAHRHCLLLLDNCEHLVDVVADFADRILAGCPGLTIVATSREALGVEGEQVLPVPPLEVPGEASPNEVTDAMHLFAHRARAVDPTFELDERTQVAVAEICRRLDGIPLAIEFAAARVAHLSPQQIAERLGDRFRLLTGGRRRIQRQQTLGAALDWSHDLLEPHEQVVFRRLAAFAGDFSLAAAEGVCGGDGIGRGKVLDLLGSLVAKSLVAIRHDDGGEARYRLLETVRMYAADKLAAAGESAAVRTRHRDWYLGWLESVPLEQLTFETARLTEVSCEMDNLRAAADWSLGEDRPELLVRQATRMFGHSFLNSSYRETRQLLKTALRSADRLSRDEQAACEATLGFLSVLAAEPGDALEHATRAIGLAAEKASPSLALAHLMKGFVTSAAASYEGSDPLLAAQARHHADQAVTVARASLAHEWLGFMQSFYAKIEIQLGDLHAALGWYRAVVQACDQGRLTRSAYAFPDALAGVATTSHLLGLRDDARAAGLRFLEFPRASTARFSWMVGTAAEVTPALCGAGRDDLVDRELRVAAPAMRRAGIPLAPNQFLIVVAVVEHLRGRPERAGRLLGAARSLGGASTLAMPFRTPASLAYYRHYLPLVRAALGAREAAKARDEGRAMTLDDAFDYALEGLDRA